MGGGKSTSSRSRSGRAENKVRRAKLGEEGRRGTVSVGKEAPVRGNTWDGSEEVAGAGAGGGSGGRRAERRRRARGGSARHFSEREAAAQLRRRTAGGAARDPAGAGARREAAATTRARRAGRGLAGLAQRSGAGMVRWRRPVG